MNVLIYADDGTSLESVKYTKECLRYHLATNYAVSTITKEELLTAPWASLTALLVIPGGADLPYCRDLNGEGNQRIQNYVRKGGKLLGICAGAYYGCSRLEFEVGTDLEVSGPRELKFYQGVARGAVYKGFQYGSDVGARAVPLVLTKTVSELQTDPNTTPDHETLTYFNGGCLFENDENAEIIAKYGGETDITSASPAAIVKKTVGQGTVLLSGAHFEYEIDPRSTDQRDVDPQVVTKLYETRSSRRRLVRYLLSKHLGLKVGVADVASIPALTDLYLSCLNGVNPTVSQYETNMSDIITESGILADSNDTFWLVKSTETQKDCPTDSQNVKKVITYESGAPAPRNTPFFNHQIYFRELERMISLQTTPTLSNLGALLMYGEVVTSTSTMLERNPQILRRIPNGLVAVGTQQTAGRGRGGNVWVNPIGVMAVSGVIRVTQTQCQQSLVFIQYLSSLAQVRAINSFLDKSIDLAIKWPNDLYLRLDDRSLAKVSGVIVTCHVFQGDFVIVFGSGTNVDNPTPTVSINSRVAELGAGAPIKLEILLARYLTMFNSMLQEFMVSGFAPFLPEYLKHWLHSDARVILERYGNAVATVKGISPETGMLVAVDDSGIKYELQPDGNSFDMMRGLLKRKI